MVFLLVGVTLSVHLSFLLNGLLKCVASSFCILDIEIGEHANQSFNPPLGVS